MEKHVAHISYASTFCTGIKKGVGRDLLICQINDAKLTTSFEKMIGGYKNENYIR